MAERYNTYCTWAHNRSTGREIRPDGEHVSATDYAALEARLASLDQKFMILQGSHDLLVKERDEWKRRCERYESREGKAVRVPDPYTGGVRWDSIAEGRDNG